MKNYSLEQLAKEINSEKTQEYFQEVLNSYYNGNNRAAIVTLYSVVICDLLHKMESLDEIYQDTTAAQILSEIEAIQNANPRNPQWETDLIEKVKNRTNIIDNVDYTHIISLQSHRHLCAHPVINKTNKLYTPNAETVASHIMNMLESLLTKPPLLSKKILGNLLIDIGNKKGKLIDEISLRRYVESKYLSNTNAASEIELFRDLWKLVFSVNNKDCNENRIINGKVLSLIYERNSEECNKKIKSNKDYFSNVLDIPDSLNAIIRFLSNFEYTYNLLKDDVKIMIEKHVKEDKNAKTVAWFLSKSFPKHLESLKKIIEEIHSNPIENRVNIKAFLRVLDIGIIKGYTKEVCEFIIWRYSKAKNYYDADEVFEYYVQEKLKLFSNEQLIKLCEGANKNGQVCDRKQSTQDHRFLLTICIERSDFHDFDSSKYANLFKV